MRILSCTCCLALLLLPSDVVSKPVHDEGSPKIASKVSEKSKSDGKASENSTATVVSKTGYRLVPNIVCTDRRGFKKKKQFSMSWQECEQACRDDPECSLFEMECGSVCILTDACHQFDDSACHSFIGYDPSKTDGSIFRVEQHLLYHPHTQARALLVPVVACVLMLAAIVTGIFRELFFGLPDIMDSMEDTWEQHFLFSLWGSEAIADHVEGARDAVTDQLEKAKEQREKEKRAMARAEHLGVDTGDVDTVSSAHCAGPIGMAIFVIISITMCSISFWPLKEQQSPRGFCGLVNKDRDPIRFKDAFTFQGSYFMHNGTLSTGLEVLPQPCWNILEEDKVTSHSGRECLAWCQDEFGDWPRPLCSLMLTFGPIYRTCFKARIFHMVHQLPEVLVSAVGCWTLAILYGLVSFAIAYYNSADNKTDDVNPPDPNQVKEDGPFHNRRPWFLCCRDPTSDYQAAKGKMLSGSVARFVDPTLDANCAMTFLVTGQPFYAFAIFAAVYGPNSDDPLQTRNSEMVLSSMSRGFPVRGMYVYARKEGCYEGVGTLIIALHALMRRAYVRDHFAWDSLSIILSASSSLLSQLPNAAEARHILFAQASGQCNVDDFYEVEKCKAKVKWIKFLPSLDCLSLGICVAITFQTTFLLAMLWFIGFVVGMCWWAFWLQLWIKKQCPGGWESICFTTAFLFWFMSPTQLGGYPHVQSNLYNGVASVHESMLRGVASLDPGHYYFIRVTTLTLFWLYAGWSRDGFFHIVFMSFAKGHGEFLVTILLVAGWIALVCEALLYFLQREHFQLKWNNFNNNSINGGYQRTSSSVFGPFGRSGTYDSKVAVSSSLSS